MVARAWPGSSTSPLCFMISDTLPLMAVRSMSPLRWARSWISRCSTTFFLACSDLPARVAPPPGSFLRRARAAPAWVRLSFTVVRRALTSRERRA